MGGNPAPAEWREPPGPEPLNTRRLTFILGGARSGKSNHALRIARAVGGRVLFIATAQPLDDEMRSRIAVHRPQRPIEWETLELPAGVGGHLLRYPQRADVVVLDCLTLLISNRLVQATADTVDPDEGAARLAVEDEIKMLLKGMDELPAHWLVVSNEVGQGIVPAYPLGRLFRDLLGWANQQVAEAADEVIWMVAGIPIPIASHRTSKTA